MLKKICFVILAVSLLAISGSTIAVGAQTEITVIRNSTDISFPQSIGFTLEAESNQDIIDIRLQYTVDRHSFAQVTSEVLFSFEPGRNVTVSWY